MATQTAVETLRDHARRIVDQAPPLTDQKRAELRELLRPMREAS